MTTKTYSTKEQYETDYNELQNLFLPHYQQVWNRIKRTAKNATMRLARDPYAIASAILAPLVLHENDKIAHFLGGVLAYRVLDTVTDEIGLDSTVGKTISFLGAIASGAGWEVLQYIVNNSPDPMNHLPIAGVVDPLDAQATAIGGIATGIIYDTKSAINAKKAKRARNNLEELVEA